MDKEGNVVESEEEGFGLKVEAKVKHPTYFLCVDETGNNTNQKDDGNVGGKKYVVSSDSDAPRKRCNSKDCRYTTMGFTSADGNLAMLAVIIEGKELKCDRFLLICHCSQFIGRRTNSSIQFLPLPPRK